MLVRIYFTVLTSLLFYGHLENPLWRTFSYFIFHTSYELLLTVQLSSLYLRIISYLLPCNRYAGRKQM